VGLGHGDYREETIDDSPEGTRARGPMRDIRVVGKDVFAAGMGRQIYRRRPNGGWERYDDRVVAPLGEIAVSGFSSIHGTGPEDLWAVGLLGEIWHHGPKGWERHDSPTNLILHRVVAVSPQEVYATGQKGLVLRFDSTAWQVVFQNGDLGNLWGAEWFAGALYVASEVGIFKLEGNTLDPVPVATATSFGHLDAKDGVMWSFGTGHLTYTRDGKNWHPVAPLI
jgi:hypothetical protein